MLIHEAVDALLTLHRSHLDEAVKAPDEATLKKAAAGDQQAVSDIFGLYYGEMMKVAKGRARGLSHDEVEDVVSDFFADKVVKGGAIKSFIAKGGKPKDLVRFFARSVMNATSSANQNKARHGLRHKEMTGAEAQPDRGSTSVATSTVRSAMKDILDAPGVPAAERQFLKALMLDPSGAASGGKGSIGKLAKQHFPGAKDPANTGTKVKKRFLKRFCSNKAICDLLKDAAPSARQKAKAFCAGVPGACVEVMEIGFALNPLLEAEGDMSEDVMEDLVLGWIREHLATEE